MISRKTIRRVAHLCVSLSAMFGATSAFAVCPAANQFTFNFSSQTAAALNYATSYPFSGTSTTLGTQPFTVSFAGNGINNATTIGNLPEISTDVNGGAGNALVMGGTWGSRTAAITSNTRVLVTTITFATPVRDLNVTLHDIDYLNTQFRDWMHITGANGAAIYTPTMVTPHGTSNGAGPFTNAASSLRLGPSTPPVTLVNQGVGVGASNNNSTDGNITVSFVEPVTSVTFRYGNYPLQPGDLNTGQQFYSISAISWCPLPVVTMTKTSAPYSDPQNGTTNPKLIPGGDLTYTLTVSNSNSSPVDASTLVLTDPLPPTLTFYNGDIDDAGPLTTNYEFTAGASGLTFGAANLSYSNTAGGGAPYVYAPGAGYDANVLGLRFAPQGTMAANSSFSLRFRARIK